MCILVVATYAWSTSRRELGLASNLLPPAALLRGAGGPLGGGAKRGGLGGETS